MKLRTISLTTYRNLTDVRIEPGERFNVLYGNNGQGKTNLLEAIYLLGTLKSFRLARNSDLIAWGSPHGMVHGVVERDGVAREIVLLVERGGKQVRVDRKAVARPGDFFGSLNVVVFSPEDMGMAKGGPDGRRRYLDRAVFTGDPAYLALYHDYLRILKNRNVLLKNNDTGELGVWSDRLAETGARLIERRLAYLREITKPLVDFYRTISGGAETAGIAYRPHLLDGTRLPGDGAHLLREGLERTSVEERRCGSTVVGPHRDDVDFLLEGRPLKVHASQGQQRSFILALKMAEIDYINGRAGAPPILLLDDMTSELDRERNANLLQFLRQRDMQVFITTTSLENVTPDAHEHCRTFLIDRGQVSARG